jgi:hypothetical protein
MFKIPRVNVIESDEGFSVEVLGRTGLLYKEGNKSIRIDSEILNQDEIAVIQESIRTWGPPYSQETIDDNKRDLIMENIRRAFAFENTKIEIW